MKSSVLSTDFNIGKYFSDGWLNNQVYNQFSGWYIPWMILSLATLGVPHFFQENMLRLANQKMSKLESNQKKSLKQMQAVRQWTFS